MVEPGAGFLELGPESGNVMGVGPAIEVSLVVEGSTTEETAVLYAARIEYLLGRRQVGH